MNLSAKLTQSLQQLKSSPSLRKRSLFFLSIVGLMIMGGYWAYSQHYISTEDAYINANVVQVASQVSGRIAHLYVENNQLVNKGKLLFELDPAPFKVAVEKAKAQLAIAEASLQHAQLSAKRTLDLVKAKVLTPQDQDNAVADLNSALATVQLAKANVTEAELNLHYTQVYALTSGLLTNLTLREGNMVSANQPLFALISNADYWVDANFKETELSTIHSGQAAKVVVDMYPDYNFKGTVTSISGGSGTAFSLLPPQNANGNWVKVTQRVPVKIQIANPSANHPLRIGTTATVTIEK